MLRINCGSRRSRCCRSASRRHTSCCRLCHASVSGTRALHGGRRIAALLRSTHANRLRAHKPARCCVCVCVCVSIFLFVRICVCVCVMMMMMMMKKKTALLLRTGHEGRTAAGLCSARDGGPPLASSSTVPSVEVRGPCTSRQGNVSEQQATHRTTQHSRHHNSPTQHTTTPTSHRICSPFPDMMLIQDVDPQHPSPSRTWHS